MAFDCGLLELCLRAPPASAAIALLFEPPAPHCAPMPTPMPMPTPPAAMAAAYSCCCVHPGAMNGGVCDGAPGVGGWLFPLQATAPPTDPGEWTGPIAHMKQDRSEYLLC